MKPTDVLELRESIIGQWFGPDGGLLDGMPTTTENLARISVVSLVQAECFYWADWTCDALASAGPHLPLAWLLQPSLLPVNKGFFYFERSLPLPSDVPGEGLRAISWAPVVQAKGRNLAIALGSGSLTPGAEHSSIIISFFMDLPNRRVPLPVSAYEFPFGRPLQEVQDEIERIQDVPTKTFLRSQRTIAKLRYFGAALSFLDQRIVQSHREHADRHTVRRLQRIRPTDVVPEVQVIRLRRVEPLDRESHDGPVDWSCQWIVRGHWRMAWLPSLSIHQPVWVRPHVKGPADKPLKLPEERIFAVVR